VPRGVAVRAVTHAGSVTLTSLAGPVTAQTNAGLITANGLTSPTADLKSNAGGIVAAFSAATGSVHASTNIGAITITVPGSGSGWNFRSSSRYGRRCKTVGLARSSSSRS
jgi:hypothetical protein